MAEIIGKCCYFAIGMLIVLLRHHSFEEQYQGKYENRK
jgi:hypothetical protein